MVFVCTADTSAPTSPPRCAARPARSGHLRGTHPGDRFNPGALAAARVTTSSCRTRRRGYCDTLDDGDLVSHRVRPGYEDLHDTAWAHWSVPDPVPSGSRAAFDAAHDVLAERIAFMAPPVTPGEAALR